MLKHPKLNLCKIQNTVSMLCTHHAASLFHFLRWQLGHMIPHGEVSPASSGLPGRLHSWEHHIPEPHVALQTQQRQFQIQQASWPDLYQTYREWIYKLAHLSLFTVKQKLPLGLYK